MYGLHSIGDYESIFNRNPTAQSSMMWNTVSPVRAGRELANSASLLTNNAIRIAERQKGRRPMPKLTFDKLIPNSSGICVVRYPSPCYSGQFSDDGMLYYTSTRDMRIHVYDMSCPTRKSILEIDDRDFRREHEHRRLLEQSTSLNPIQTIDAPGGQWTITDTTMSQDKQWIVYSSITPLVDMARVGTMVSQNHTLLDLSERDEGNFGIWSVRFSASSNEILAGAQNGSIILYDVQTQRRLLNIQGHDDDVNAVTYAEAGSSNLIVTGSDDSLLKVWDRRIMNKQLPSGYLPGHTEGITYIDTKGDGRYCISNSKDQSVRLWDLRMLRSRLNVERWSHMHYGHHNWDYRYESYPRPNVLAHPEDCSVMVYRGHSVLRTLIRCRFSPSSTTGQQYISSGSADGHVYIWTLDGQIIGRLESGNAFSIGSRGRALDPSASEWSYPPRHSSSNDGTQRTVRDISWHPGAPVLLSTVWDGSFGGGSVVQHEWKDHGRKSSY
ncbi:hypothetical protein MCUN1_003189 [Malassezia cuniculi]|uniref:WD40 repeat-like protein n=1 Tax=Malassezia cuniculi TaxID=948313 RepID=A0AAF0ET63_9BASI|nr:hypothetical protein MCUN1_003189 [Malassezia cuniculi]